MFLRFRRSLERRKAASQKESEQTEHKSEKAQYPASIHGRSGGVAQAIVPSAKEPLPNFVLVVSNATFPGKVHKFKKAAKKGKLQASLEVYSQADATQEEFVARFGGVKPTRGFELNTIYQFLEARQCYVRECDYVYEFEMSRLEEAIVLLKDAGAYSITIDERLFSEYTKAAGKNVKLSLPVATPLGDVGAASGQVEYADNAALSNRSTRSIETIFSKEPTHARHYDSKGKWFYQNGLQEKTIEMVVKAVERGLEPPTMETTIHFKREAGSSTVSELSASLERFNADKVPTQVLGLAKSCKAESKTEFDLSFKVVFFSKEDMDKVTTAIPSGATAIESLRRSGGRLAHLRLDFYDDRRHLRDDVVVHLARGETLIEELTSEMVVEEAFTDEQQRARLEAVFAGESGSLKDWLQALRLAEYHGKFVEAGCKDVGDLALVSEEDLGTLGITKPIEKKKLLNALKALKDANEQRRRGAERRPAAVYELAQAAFFNRQVTEPGLSLVMPFTLYGPGGVGSERTSALFTWQQALVGSPSGFMNDDSARVEWNVCTGAPGKYTFCKGVKFGKGRNGRNEQGLEGLSPDEYAAISDKNHAEIWMWDTDPAVDPYTNKYGIALPFGLLVLVLDFAEVAAARAEAREAGSALGGALASAFVGKVTPLLGTTFEEIKNSLQPTGNTLRDKIFGAQSNSQRGTLLRYPPLATLLVDNDTAVMRTGAAVNAESDYVDVCTWLRESFQLTYVFAMPKLAPPTPEEQNLFHSNVTFKAKYIKEWNRSAECALSALSSIINAAAHHEQCAAARLRAARSVSTP